MSLWINVTRVTSVLLADGWHRVADDSFYLDSYEYLESDEDDAMCLHGGGNSGVCATGFSFVENMDEGAGGARIEIRIRISGPLTAILAVQERPRP